MELEELKGTLRSCQALIDRADAQELALDIDRLLEDPILTNSVVVDVLHLLPQTERPETVLSASDDALFGFALATAAWSRFYYADVEGPQAALGHGFKLPAARKSYVAVPVLEDPAQVQALIALLRDADAKVAGVLALQSKIDADQVDDVPVHALLTSANA